MKLLVTGQKYTEFSKNILIFKANGNQVPLRTAE